MASIELRERMLFRALWAVIIVAFLAGIAFWVGDVSSLAAGTTGMTGTRRSATPVPQPGDGDFAALTGSETFTAEEPDAESVLRDQCLQAFAAGSALPAHGSTLFVVDPTTGETRQIADPADC